MRNPGGNISMIGPEGQFEERDTYTCAHCQRITILASKQPPHGGCRICGGNICSGCLGKSCTPWEKQMDDAEARQDFRRELGLL